MAVTTGRRVYADSEGRLRLAEGDYGQEKDGTWSVRPPGEHAGGIPDHTVTEHDDGTITVEPSIVLERGDRRRSSFHGYLERGVWRTA